MTCGFVRVLAVAAVCVFAGGAVGQVDDGWGSSPARKPAVKDAAKPEAKPEVKPGAGQPVKGVTWSVVLVTFRGEGQGELAAAALKIARDGGLSDAYAERRGEATVVAVGRFADRSSADAVGRLNEVKAMVVDGRKPYQSALLAPSGALTDLGSRPEWNLVKAKEEAGERGKYTLQVAAYGAPDGKEPTAEELAESRRAAEEAVARLRQEGEQAFYYHSLGGKKLSMVCVGAWNDDDLAKKGDAQNDVRGRMENPDLTALRVRFPFNLVNGKEAKELEKGADGKIRVDKDGKPVGKPQRSRLVLIPAQ